MLNAVSAKGGTLSGCPLAGVRILVVGAGGVGAAAATIARHRSFFEHLMLADVDGDRAARHLPPLRGRQRGDDAPRRLELLADGVWSGAGVLGPEAFDAAPFLQLLADCGSPHGVQER